MATNGPGGWFRRLFSRSKHVPLDPSRDDLVVVASSFDDAEACSRALERSSAGPSPWKEADDVVLRHHLLLPSGTVEDAAAIAAQDGYALGAASVDPSVTLGPVPEVVNGVPVVLERVQVLDALHCSQERSRMAGLAQRRGGVVLGWEALQPASPSADAAN
jgi:hypothetical protein